MSRRKKKASSEVNLGFQIAPMIDVVFVILLYFMVMAGSIQKENAHNTKLPGTKESDTPQDAPDEISIQIQEDGQVSLNEDPLDNPEGPLTELALSLKQLKNSSDAGQTPLLVTIYAADTAEYQRVIDVLDCLGQARIENVTFQAGFDE
jgi:biopolymer transport protein ExbD